ncbi:hypothetical protein ACFQPA_13005 [Halomarina halobia]|uniref:Uncharacterized protein n=1 Tax=Halomarina halobia TaxID=3033386 RepID=A0ABD6A9B4_9EURY|nr:hypothetical protein [Halomarina sp. PSR21]
MPSDSRRRGPRSPHPGSSADDGDSALESIGVLALVVIAGLVVVAVAGAIALWTLPSLVDQSDASGGASDPGDAVGAVGNGTPSAEPPSSSDDRTDEPARSAEGSFTGSPAQSPTASPSSEPARTDSPTPTPAPDAAETPESTPTPAPTETPASGPTSESPSEQPSSEQPPSERSSAGQPSDPSTPSADAPDFVDPGNGGDRAAERDGGSYSEEWGVPENGDGPASDVWSGDSAGELEWQNASSENAL